MAITRTIGKNTLGDNNKMKVRLREYDMSSQNLSYVFRSTMGVGMLVPFMKIVCQKGDIFDIKLTNKTMTHPTLGHYSGASSYNISSSQQDSDCTTAGCTTIGQESE